jgi:hypothetical protein
MEHGRRAAGEANTRFNFEFVVFQTHFSLANQAGRAYVWGKRGAVSSVVEHHLDTVGVTGSIPVSRTISQGGKFDNAEFETLQ